MGRRYRRTKGLPKICLYSVGTLQPSKHQQHHAEHQPAVTKGTTDAAHIAERRVTRMRHGVGTGVEDEEILDCLIPRSDAAGGAAFSVPWSSTRAPHANPRGSR